MSNPAEGKDKVIITADIFKQADWGFRGNSDIRFVEFEGEPDSVTSYSFCQCVNLEQIHLPDSVRSIGQAAFQGCKKLSSIQLPIGLDEICDEAFSGCESLVSVYFNSSPIRIGKSVFSACKSLKEVYIYDSLVIDKGAFSGCGELTLYTLKGSAVERFANEEGVHCKCLPWDEFPELELLDETDLDQQLRSKKLFYPAVIAERNGHRFLIYNDISYYRDTSRMKYTEFMTDYHGQQYKKEYYSRKDFLDALAQEIKAHRGDAYYYVINGPYDDDRISKYDDALAEAAYESFWQICDVLAYEPALRLIADYLPTKKDGTLTLRRNTLIASLPVFEHTSSHYSVNESKKGTQKLIDRRYDSSWDIVAKTVSETEVKVCLERVDIFKEIEQDYHKFNMKMADPRIAEKILEFADTEDYTQSAAVDLCIRRFVEGNIGTYMYLRRELQRAPSREEIGEELNVNAEELEGILKLARELGYPEFPFADA